MAPIVTSVTCPCGCGEAVTLTDQGFYASTVKVTCCTGAQAKGWKSWTMPKTAGLALLPAAAGPVRHAAGLVWVG